MKRETIYGALIAGLLLSAPVLSPAVAFADEDETSTSVELSDLVDFDEDETTSVDLSDVVDLDEDGTGDVPSVRDADDVPQPGDTGSTPGRGGTGKTPQSQAGPKYGPNIDGWVVKVTNDGKGKLAFSSPGFSDNVASMSPSAGSEIGPGQTGAVKGKQSASSVFNAKEPANMNFMVKAGRFDYTIKVRDTSGYDSPAKVDCTTGMTGGGCTVVSNAKNKEIVVSLSSL
jgi:hypothetical protein